MRCLLLSLLLTAALVSAQDADTTPVTTLDSSASPMDNPSSTPMTSDIMDDGTFSVPSDPAGTSAVFSTETLVSNNTTPAGTSTEVLPETPGSNNMTANNTEPSGNATTQTSTSPSSAVTISCFSAALLCIIGLLAVS